MDVSTNSRRRASQDLDIDPVRPRCRNGFRRTMRSSQQRIGISNNVTRHVKWGGYNGDGRQACVTPEISRSPR
ncbi:hypothetical protein M407DRAFT_87761 [Tulasnella calospora MUT 4182]|uniref:Uncharacterized protein n=1 Tax=Tulasnella calospora MUT 4182 TaxID=1051891 RepID=A0A0C3QN13_9AGAM|nr:hypothetical protein M407DRAFT_87761 [Tulasnella calospora MUT 4182]